MESAAFVITSAISRLALPLFVPADRPDQYGKAFISGADSVIVDLEDSVAAESKDRARRQLEGAWATLVSGVCPPLVRINPEGSPFHAADLAAVRALRLAGVVVAKTETAETVRRVIDATGLPVLALIENARGLAAAREIAAAGARLAFGSLNFAADLGCAHDREALLFARSEIVLASRLARMPAPIDAASTSIADTDRVRADAAHAASLGFGGKFLIHPAQIEPAAAGLQPTNEETARASRVIAGRENGGANCFESGMIDVPERLRAAQIIRRVQGTRKPRPSVQS